MERIRIHDKQFRPYITNGQIEKAIEQVAAKINADYSGEYSDTMCPIFISVLNGAFMFTASLMQKIDFKCEISFVKLASYEGTSSTGAARQLIGLNNEINGRKVIIIEDIVDTGNTIVELFRILNERGASDIRVCTMCFKPGSYSKDIPIDYPAMNISNEFIVGYGLDYDQLGRQYKDIYIVD